jgi:nucleosome binding factor SPN SPT16 subunit
MSITIDGALFWARLQKVHGAWQGSLKNRSFGGADALFVVTGKIDDDAPPFQRSQSLHLFLIQYEFPELAMLFTETGLTILSSDKKLKHLEPLLAAKPEGCALSLALLARNKADKNAENYATLLKLAKGSGKGAKLGVLGKEAPLGAFAEQTKEAVDAAGLERADVTKGFGLALAPKDSVELGHLRTAAKLTSRLLRKVFVDEMETIIDEEKKVKHSAIAVKLTAHLEAPEKLKLLHSKKDVIDADDVEACFEPAVQSGGSYVTKLSAQSSDAPMTSDVVIASMGVRYKSYCGMIARTFMVDPVKKVERAYLLLQSLHEYLCDTQLKAGAVVADVVVAAQKFVKERDESLLPHLSKSIGWGVGLEIRDSALTLDTKNEARLQAGMCVTVCVSFSKVALSAKERKLADGAAGGSVYPLESFSLMLADVVAVGEAGAPSELLTKSETRFDSVQYTLGGDSDEDEDEDDEPDESEQNEPGIPSGSDPRSDRTFLLPSLFVGRPDTVWFDYPPYMGVMRQEGRSTISELTEKRLRPLWFKSDRNINCITNAFKRSGFRRLIKGTSYNLYWGKHLNEKAMRALGPHQVAFSPPRLSRSVAAPRAHTPRRARARSRPARRRPRSG